MFVRCKVGINPQGSLGRSHESLIELWFGCQNPILIYFVVRTILSLIHFILTHFVVRTPSSLISLSEPHPDSCHCQNPLLIPMVEGIFQPCIILEFPESDQSLPNPQVKVRCLSESSRLSAAPPTIHTDWGISSGG